MRVSSCLTILAVIVLFNVEVINGANPLTVTGRFKNTNFRNVGSFLTFNIYKFNIISEDNVEINSSRNESVQGLNSRGNDEIEFLPVKVYEKFPNLVVYQVRDSIVKNVVYKNFEKLIELETLYLYDNQILHIANDAFKDLLKLKHLDLDENLLTNICFIHDVTSLWMVDLTGNQIVHVPSDAFEHLTELRNISLKINQMTSFDSNYFSKNKKLEYIWLNNNKFKSVNPVNFDDKNNLIYVDLKSNVCINDYYRNFTEMRNHINVKCMQKIETAPQNDSCH